MLSSRSRGTSFEKPPEQSMREPLPQPDPTYCTGDYGLDHPKLASLPTRHQNILDPSLPLPRNFNLITRRLPCSPQGTDRVLMRRDLVPSVTSRYNHLIVSSHSPSSSKRSKRFRSQNSSTNHGNPRLDGRGVIFAVILRTESRGRPPQLVLPMRS